MRVAALVEINPERLRATAEELPDDSSCTVILDVAVYECGNWNPIGDTAADTCTCGANHTVEELMDDLNPASSMSPKDQSMADDGPYCGECLNFENRVVPLSDDIMVCLDCLQRFENYVISACDWCSITWIDYDTENSFMMGCEHCEGRDLDRD